MRTLLALKAQPSTASGSHLLPGVATRWTNGGLGCAFALLLSALTCLGAVPIGFNSQPIPGLVGWWTFDDAAFYGGPIDSSLVGWWKMDEGSGTVSTADSSGNGNTGYLTNSPAWGSGVIGSGLTFDGVNQYAQANVQLNGHAATFTWWMNETDYDDYRDIIRDTNEVPAVYIYTGKTSGALAINVAGNITNITAIGVSVWHHVAVTYSLGTISIFVDGAQAKSCPLIDNVLTLAAIKIGAQANGGSEFFKGTLDDLRIYNRALSPSEVLAIYQTEAPRYSTSDKSGFNNVGYLTNAPSWTNGVMGGGLYFNQASSQVVGVGSVSSFQITYPITIAFWGKATTFASGSSPDWDDYYVAIGEDSVVGSMVVQLFGQPGGGLYQLMRNGTTGADRHFCANESLISAGTWHHIVAVDSGTAMTVYVDTVASTNNLESFSRAAANGNLTIGGRGYSGNYTLYADGAIDDVRIYNRALTADEVKLLYGGGYGYQK